MRRLILLMMLLLIPIAYSLEDCINIMPLTERNIPCRLTNPFPYSENCNTYLVKFYNSTPSEIGRHLMDDYTGTDLCNLTFNFTKKGTYFVNISSGDSARLIVESEDDNMASFAVMILMMTITAVIFWVAYTKQFFPKSPVADYLIRKSIYIVGVLFVAMNIAMALTLSQNFGLGLENELFLLLWFSHKGAYIAMILLFVFGIIKAVQMWKLQKQSERMGET